MSGLRIGGGALRGRGLLSLKGDRIRPTSGRLKKSLFDVLGASIRDARVLDLFAGAGALGIESLSRGAAFVVFVDKARPATEMMARNLDALELSTKANVLRGDAVRVVSGLAAAGESFDLVFADPPYDASEKASEVLETLGLGGDDGGPLTDEARVVIEHHHKTALSERYGSLELFRTLRAGESVASLYAKTESFSPV